MSRDLRCVRPEGPHVSQRALGKSADTTTAVQSNSLDGATSDSPEAVLWRSEGEQEDLELGLVAGWQLAVAPGGG